MLSYNLCHPGLRRCGQKSRRPNGQAIYPLAQSDIVGGFEAERHVQFIPPSYQPGAEVVQLMTLRRKAI